MRHPVFREIIHFFLVLYIYIKNFCFQISISNDFSIEISLSIFISKSFFKNLFGSAVSFKKFVFYKKFYQSFFKRDQNLINEIVLISLLIIYLIMALLKFVIIKKKLLLFANPFSINELNNLLYVINLYIILNSQNKKNTGSISNL